jgi:hypothetical protein
MIQMRNRANGLANTSPSLHEVSSKASAAYRYVDLDV